MVGTGTVLAQSHLPYYLQYAFRLYISNSKNYFFSYLPRCNCVLSVVQGFSKVFSQICKLLYVYMYAFSRCFYFYYYFLLNVICILFSQYG